MKKRQRASSATLFLMELIVAVMYFSLAATVCIAIFVRAHVMSEDAKDLNAAVNMASDAAETIRSTDSLDGAGKTFVRNFPEAMITNTDNGATVRLYYNESREPCGTDSAHYQMEIAMSDKGGMISSDITVSDMDQKEIYSLSVNHAIKD